MRDHLVFFHDWGNNVTLHWKFDQLGGWTAESKRTDLGETLHWAIAVCDDGTFTVAESDSFLTCSNQCFATLQEAQRWCDCEELLLPTGDAK